jgi:hypothetical protein
MSSKSEKRWPCPRRISVRVDVLFTWVLLVIPAIHVQAQSIRIGPLKNANPQDVSSVSAECEPSTDGRRMTCNFIQVRVDLVKTPEAAAAELEEQLRDTTTISQARAEMCKNQGQEMAGLTAKLEATQDVPPRLKVFVAGLMQRFKAICQKPTIESMREFLQYTLEKETKTCRIWANPWQETFTKQSRDKWVSNRGPSGICGVVTVSTLESKPMNLKKPDNLVLQHWTYETQKIMTTKEAGEQLCFFDETKIRYAWNAKEFDRECEFIEFGF